MHTISQKIEQYSKYRHHFVIECDITNEKSILSILDQHWTESQNSTNTNIVTNLGLTVLSLHPKLSHAELINEYLIGINVQFPVCNKLLVNRRPKLYTSELDYQIMHDTSHTNANSHQNMIWDGSIWRVKDSDAAPPASAPSTSNVNSTAPSILDTNMIPTTIINTRLFTFMASRNTRPVRVIMYKNPLTGESECAGRAVSILQAHIPNMRIITTFGSSNNRFAMTNDTFL